jgi:hypothetical protein
LIVPPPASRLSVVVYAGYGLKKGMRGRFATYVPPVVEARLAELEHNPRNNRMRAG